MAKGLWRTLVVVHRYLGIAVGLLMLMWFGSGIVMMYVGYPELSDADRLRALSPINWRTCCNFGDAGFRDNEQFGRVEVESLLGRPVLRLARPPLPDDLIDLAAGRRMDPVDLERAEAIARDAVPRMLGQPAALVDAADIEGDAWTVGLGVREGELFRFAFDDPQHSFIYVSPGGRVVLRTTASERFWNWFGAIPHWLYFAPLRRDGRLWSQTVIWTSILGTFLTVVGLGLGIVQLGRRKGGRLSPYRGWHLWHHWAGLVFGIVTLTWVFSGLVSMNPWGFLQSRPGDELQSRPGDERVRLVGALPRWSEIERSLVAMRARSDGDLTLIAAPLAGHLYWLAGAPDGTETRWDEAGHAAPLTPDDLSAAATRLAGGGRIASQGVMDKDDDYYFSRDRVRAALPVYRVVLGDAARTRYYLDPVSGALLQRIDANARWHRWLFAALHRLDFAAWLRARPLWDVLVLALMLGGLGVSATGCWLALRRMRADVAGILRRQPASVHHAEAAVGRPPASGGLAK